jgi:hypothetical protein
MGIRQCPRCGYQGQGISYFSRPGHVGLLLGVSLFTYGLGGLVYWLARRKHRICPDCGLGWENARRPDEVESPAGRMRGEESSAGSLPSSGIKRRVLGVLLVLLATFLIVMGVVEVEMAAVAMGSVLGLAGSGTFFWGWKALESRRQALLGRLQRRVLRLARARGGSLTVTEVAAELDVSLPVAEKVLIAMDDGFRVRSDITREGVLLYEFPEVQHRLRLEGGS